MRSALGAWAVAFGLIGLAVIGFVFLDMAHTFREWRRRTRHVKLPVAVARSPWWKRFGRLDELGRHCSRCHARLPMAMSDHEAELHGRVCSWCQELAAFPTASQDDAVDAHRATIRRVMRPVPTSVPGAGERRLG